MSQFQELLNQIHSISQSLNIIIQHIQLNITPTSNTFRFVDIAMPIDSLDVANKLYVDSITPDNIVNFDDGVRRNPLDTLAVPIGPIDCGGVLLNNVGAPIDNDDAATKYYVDARNEFLLRELNLLKDQILSIQEQKSHQ